MQYEAGAPTLIPASESRRWLRTPFCTLLRALGMLPVAFVVAFMFGTYYPLVVLALLPAHAYLALVLYHALLVLTTASYVRTS